MNWSDFAKSAICVPFCEHGRDYHGWDCWGLLQNGYRDVLGVELPYFLDAYENTSDYKSMLTLVKNECNIRWEECSRKIGTVALIKRRGHLIHTGIVITKYEILHCDRGAGTVIELDRNMNIESFWSLK